MAKKAIGKIESIRQALNAALHERRDFIDGILTALLAKENLFVLGPPGTAKSLTCELLCKAAGGNFFSWLLVKTTTPDELFGTVSIAGLKNDDYKRVTTNKLPEAHFAFLDEIFKGSSAILNTLLPVINERKFYNGAAGPAPIPLQFVLGASNEVPQAEELGALYDRFALRFVVDRLQNDSSVEMLLSSASKPVQIPSITLAEIEAEQKAASEVQLPDSIIKTIVEMRKLINNEGIYVSDRKWVQSVRIVKAYAHLNGHDTVTDSDLEILQNVLWSDPGQIKTVKRIVAKVSNPLGEQILKWTDAVAEVKDSLNKGQILPTDAVSKLKTAVKELQKLGSPDKNLRLKEALEKTREVQLWILKEHLGME